MIPDCDLKQKGRQLEGQPLRNGERNDMIILLSGEGPSRKGRTIMKEILQNRCELLLRNRDAVKEAFPWNSGMVHLCCANVYTMRGMTADTASLKASRNVLRSRVGVFSGFRGISEDVLATMLDVSGDAEGLMDKAKKVYELLREEFMSSDFLPMAAIVIAQDVAESEYAQVAARTRSLYLRMRKEHPMITGADDSVMCALMAMTGRDEEALIADMETCYERLHGEFFSGNSVQAATHVMTMLPGRAEDKCDRMLSLRDAMKTAGNKWGTYYELPVLTLLAESGMREDMLVEDIISCDEWLAKQKGFGFFSSVSRTMRLMYAGLMTLDTSDMADAAAINGVLAAVIAQEAATAACIAASVAAANASSSSH